MTPTPHSPSHRAVRARPAQPRHQPAAATRGSSPRAGNAGTTDVPVFAGTILAISVIASLISFFAGQALLNSHHLGVSITAPGALRSVIGAALYVTVAGMIGVALGALLRSTAAGIASFTGVFFVLPPLLSLLPATVSNHLAPYLPSNAGEVLWGGAYKVQNALSPWTGFAVLRGYAVVLTGAAAWRLRRADA